MFITHTMENTTDVEYISMYDKPKRGRGRPRGSNYSDEEKLQRRLEANSRCYYNNYEYYSLQKRSYTQAVYEAKIRMKFIKSITFFVFFNEFPFKRLSSLLYTREIKPDSNNNNFVIQKCQLLI